MRRTAQKRMMRATALAALISGAAWAQTPPPLPAPPPQDFSKVEVRATDLGHGVYMFDGTLAGIGGNITLAVGNDGAIMVDAAYADLSDRVKAAMAKVSKVPVRYLINTHFHGDHTGGNVNFAKDGAVLLAHDNLRKRMDMEMPNADGTTRARPPFAALSTITYDGTLTVRVTGQTAEIFHMPPAHTDGDSYIYFRDANILSTGDLYFSNRYPAIDTAAGGGVAQMLASADVLLKLVNAQTKIIPGHGPLSDRAGLTQFRAMLATVKERVSKLIAQGKSEDEIVAAKPLTDLDAKWANNATAGERFLRIAVRSLKPS